MLKIGSHVGLSAPKMMLGSAQEAHSYGANTFMIYTGAPQNTRRKPVEELNIEAAWNFMNEHDISDIVVHAPYIINLANTVKPETFELAVEFLAKEIDRTHAVRSKTLVLHPGAHVGAGVEAGLTQIVNGLNEVLTKDTPVNIALETMAGKGTEIGRTFDELAYLFEHVVHSDKLRVCFDTCHVHDSGYDLVNDFGGVLESFDRLIGKDKIAAFHINDSKNVLGAKKDRHENIGFGNIGFDALKYIMYHEDFKDIPKILETPYVPVNPEDKKKIPPYKYEIEMFKAGEFNPNILEDIINQR